jgi:hypothetical protein
MASSFNDLIMLARSDERLLPYDQVLRCRLTGGSHLNCDLSSCSSLMFKIPLYRMSYTKLMWSAQPNDAQFNFPWHIKGPDDVTGQPVWFPVHYFRWILYASLEIMCLTGGRLGGSITVSISSYSGLRPHYEGPSHERQRPS